jgi:hypothetical protein
MELSLDRQKQHPYTPNRQKQVLIKQTNLTLLVVPAAYDLFDDWQGFFKRRRERKEAEKERRKD